MSLIQSCEKEIEVLLPYEKEDDFKRHIVLHNDDYNTFDFVIKSLIDICDHTLHQAEQCTLIVHYSGKCEVKSGTLTDLEPRCKRLLQRGLKAEII